MTGCNWYQHQHNSKLFVGHEFFYWGNQPQYPKPMSTFWLIISMAPGRKQLHSTLYIGENRPARDFDMSNSRRMYYSSDVLLGPQPLLDWATDIVATPMQLLSHVLQKA